MKKQDVLDHFGGVVKTSQALHISHASVSDWGDVVPEAAASRADRVSNGKLKYDHEFYISLKAEKKKAA